MYRDTLSMIRCTKDTHVATTDAIGSYSNHDAVQFNTV